MSVHLRPSFLRSTASVTLALAALAVATYFWQGYRENHWWTHRYMLSLLIPFGIAPLMVWFMFVPARLEFSDKDFTIRFPFRPLHTLDWSDLQHYGSGPNVFMIQFAGVGTFQIFPQAFRRSEWRMLKSFLSTTFPDRKASGYFGDRMFKWPWRKT
ncbi:MAG TPA: hypothetical protein VM940_08955 [Chthoniobacterales bacterium]|jgi:hypothetical protein|nr:hypothetical protein [Chthoniobacterales bacterium]